MRFLIVTGIYPPEIGGPAFYAKNLAAALRKKGHQVEVRTFGVLKRLPTGLRHVGLFARTIPAARRAEKIIALDTFSAALPALFAAALFGKKILVRTGGDFLWEQYVERTGDLVPLPFFYQKHKPFTRKERIYYSLTKFLVRRSLVAFSSRFQKDIWVKAYGANPNSPIVDNAISGLLEPVAPEKQNFILFGRDLKLRNKKKLALAFQTAKKILPDISLETGQLSQSELLEKMRRAYAVILPSISDITPNLILDALRCGKPFILTKYSEYASRYADFGFFVDPLDDQDIAAKILALSDREKYNELAKRIAENFTVRSYNDLAEDFITIAGTV